MSYCVKCGMIMGLVVSLMAFAGCADGNPDTARNDSNPDHVQAEAERLALEAGVDSTDLHVLEGTTSGTAVPFRAVFETRGGVDPEDERCGPPPNRYNVQEGEGEAIDLGSFSTRIDFCVDVSELGPDAPLDEDESIPYDEGRGTFILSNGDQLEFTISGNIFPSDRPDYDFEFSDTFYFTGGTGQFEGASGVGVTNSFVDLPDQRTDHDWSGVLVLSGGP